MKILLPFKNKNSFTLVNLSKYGHITLKFVDRYFYLVVTIFSKNMAILVQKFGEEIEQLIPFLKKTVVHICVGLGVIWTIYICVGLVVSWTI